MQRLAGPDPQPPPPDPAAMAAAAEAGGVDPAPALEAAARASRGPVAPVQAPIETAANVAAPPAEPQGPPTAQEQLDIMSQAAMDDKLDPPESDGLSFGEKLLVGLAGLNEGGLAGAALAVIEAGVLEEEQAKDLQDKVDRQEVTALSIEAAGESGPTAYRQGAATLARMGDIDGAEGLLKTWYDDSRARLEEAKINTELLSNRLSLAGEGREQEMHEAELRGQQIDNEITALDADYNRARNALGPGKVTKSGARTGGSGRGGNGGGPQQGATTDTVQVNPDGTATVRDDISGNTSPIPGIMFAPGTEATNVKVTEAHKRTLTLLPNMIGDYQTMREAVQNGVRFRSWRPELLSAQLDGGVTGLEMDPLQWMDRLVVQAGLDPQQQQGEFAMLRYAASAVYAQSGAAITASEFLRKIEGFMALDTDAPETVVDKVDATAREIAGNYSSLPTDLQARAVSASKANSGLTVDDLEPSATPPPASAVGEGVDRKSVV